MVERIITRAPVLPDLRGLHIPYEQWRRSKGLDRETPTLILPKLGDEITELGMEIPVFDVHKTALEAADVFLYAMTVPGCLGVPLEDVLSTNGHRITRFDELEHRAADLISARRLQLNPRLTQHLMTTFTHLTDSVDQDNTALLISNSAEIMMIASSVVKLLRLPLSVVLTAKFLRNLLKYSISDDTMATQRDRWNGALDKAILRLQLGEIREIVVND